MGQKIKYSITEERLARLVSESIEEVLLEAKNDEGLGKFLGGLAGKVRNGVNKFRDDYNASRNAQLYKNRDYDSYTANGLDPNARNFDKTMSQNYRSTLQKGASASAPGSFTTPYGDSVGGKRGSDERANQNTLQQMQEMLAALTQQMQTLIQNNNGPQGGTVVLKATLAVLKVILVELKVQLKEHKAQQVALKVQQAEHKEVLAVLKIVSL